MWLAGAGDVCPESERGAVVPGLDVFNASGFNMQALTARVLTPKYVPRQLGDLGIFEAEGVPTTTVAIERDGNSLVLVPTTPRGGPATQNQGTKRDYMPFPTYRHALDDTITADMVQNIRAFGSDNQLQTLAEVIAKRQQNMSDSLDATEEFHRINAIRGTLLNADGSTLLDLSAAFGVTAQTEQAWDIANQAEGALKNKVSDSLRLMEDELDGVGYTGAHVMCSSQFYDAMLAHKDVREALKGFPDGARVLLGRTARRQFDFAGATFEEYRGKIGNTKYVPDNKAFLIPIGAQGNFITRYAPAEFFETVNTLGLPRYSMMLNGSQPEISRILRVQTQLITLCTRPRTVIPIRQGA